MTQPQMEADWQCVSTSSDTFTEEQLDKFDCTNHQFAMSSNKKMPDDLKERDCVIIDKVGHFSRGKIQKISGFTHRCRPRRLHGTSKIHASA